MDTHWGIYYNKTADSVMSACEVTGFAQIVVDPCGASYCDACSERVEVPAPVLAEYQPVAPAPVALVIADGSDDDDAAPLVLTEREILPCGCVDHENGGPADYGPECRR